MPYARRGGQISIWVYHPRNKIRANRWRVAQLIYWTQAGLITAAVREAQGTGHHRLFNFHNLVEVAVARALARAGLTLPGIRRVLTVLTPPGNQPSGETGDALLFLTGDLTQPRAIWTGTRVEFAAELDSAFLINDPVGLLIDVGRIARDLAAHMGRLA